MIQPRNSFLGWGWTQILKRFIDFSAQAVVESLSFDQAADDVLEQAKAMTEGA